MNIDDDRNKYLIKQKKEKILIMFFRLFILFLLISLWEILAYYNIINTFLYSSPSRVVKTIMDLFINNNLLSHIFVTIFEVTFGFILSSFIGIFVPILLWKHNFIEKILDPYLTIINSLPKVSLGPLIIIWIGASTNSVIFMALLISCFITIINVYNGFINTNKDYINLLKSYHAKNYEIIKYAILPFNYSNIISSLKVNISMCLIGVIMGELLVSKKGIGYLIMYGSQVFNINLIITCIFILGIISFLFYYIICLIEKIFFKNKKR